MKLEIEIPEATLCALVGTALTGGSAGTGAWARIEIGDDLLTATVTDRYTGQSVQLSPERLLRGMRILADKNPAMFGALWGSACDAYAADTVVQCAVFGEILYS